MSSVFLLSWATRAIRLLAAILYILMLTVLCNLSFSLSLKTWTVSLHQTTNSLIHDPCSLTLRNKFIFQIIGLTETYTLSAFQPAKNI